MGWQLEGHGWTKEEALAWTLPVESPLPVVLAGDLDWVLVPDTWGLLEDLVPGGHVLYPKMTILQNIISTLKFVICPKFIHQTLGFEGKKVIVTVVTFDHKNKDKRF